LEADPFISVVASPLGLLACVAIGVGSLLAYQSMRRRWASIGASAPMRVRDLLVLVATAVSALFLVVLGGVVLDERDSRARMQRELTERSAQSQALRTQIGAQVDAARRMLADRAVERVTQHKLAEARAELLRFAGFQDPGISQMILLIDRELAIRATEPDRLSPDAGK
jgi:hypothetical protein